MVSARLLTVATELLQKVALGVSDTEVAHLIEVLKEAARGEVDPAGFERLPLQISAIRQAMKDNALSERA